MISTGVEFVNHLVHHDDKRHVDSFEYASSFEVPKTYMYSYESSTILKQVVNNLFQYDIAFH